MADKWTKKRHRVFQRLAAVFVGIVVKLKYGIKIDKFPDKTGQYVVLMNHQTVGDQFFVAMCMNQTLYFIATEDIFSNGLISRILEFATKPIPIKKQTTDLKAVMTAIRVSREGATIALAPEGNRTYSGRTAYIKSSIAPFIRKLKLPVAFFKIEGGYGSQPRWSDKIRKGPIHAGISKVIGVEEYSKLDDEQFVKLIRDELYVDEAVADAEYKYKKQAEFLERAIYVCPDCGFSRFHSHGDIIECDTCHKQVRHRADKSLEGVNCDFPFRFVGEWYDYQSEFVNHTDVTKLVDEPIFTDTARIYEVILYHNKKLLRKKAKLELYGNRIVIDSGTAEEKTFMFDNVEATSVLGRNKANVYIDNKVYQFKSTKDFNALKYVNIFYRYRNIMKGDNNAEFLGI